MNIIQVCPYDLSIPGGVQTHITHLSNELVRKDHNVMVLAPSLKNSGFERKFNCQVEYITASVRIPWWGTSIDISLLKRDEKKRVFGLFETFDPDIIHFHTIWNPVFQTQLLWMVPPDIKKVGTFHDTPPDQGLGKYIGSNLMKVGASYYLPKMDEIISVSETQSRAMGVDPEMHPENFSIIPNGIHIPEGLSKEEGASAEDEFRIIFVGRFEVRKGIFELLDILSRLQRSDLKKKISLHLVGSGPQESEVNDFISNNELKNVEIFKNTSDEERDRLIINSDLMVAPALYGESFGIVLLEAMALGVKVAGYGNEGYLTVGSQYGDENFPTPGDKNALYNVIRDHIETPEKTDHLIEKGINIAGRYDWKVITDKIITLYER